MTSTTYLYWRTFCTISGCCLILMPNCFRLYWGNLYVYASSYFMAKNVRPSTAESLWLINVYSICLTISMSVGGQIALVIGRRAMLVFSCVLFNASVMACYFVLDSSWPVFTLVCGFSFGTGSGLMYGLLLEIVVEQTDNYVGTLSNVVESATGLGAAIINEYLTLFINPDNEVPYLEKGANRYFTQQDLIHRVPKAFLFLGMGGSIVQLLGLSLLWYGYWNRERKNNTCTGGAQTVSVVPEKLAVLEKRDLCFQEGSRSYQLAEGSHHQQSTEGSHYQGSAEGSPTESSHYQQPIESSHYRQPTESSHYQQPTVGSHYQQPAESSLYRQSTEGSRYHQLAENSAQAVSNHHQRSKNRLDWQPIKKALSCKAFYCLWTVTGLSDCILVVAATYYKQVGFVTIRDDHFLTTLGTTTTLTLIGFQCATGFLADKIGFANISVLSFAVLTVISVFYAFTPLLNKWLYFAVSVLYICLANAYSRVIVVGVKEKMGAANFAINYGLVWTGTPLFELPTPPLFQIILRNFNWHGLFMSLGILCMATLILSAKCL